MKTITKPPRDGKKYSPTPAGKSFIKELQSSRRARTVARPRQVAMYLAKQLTSRSLPEIGRKFDRDHTTVMHAVRKVEELIIEDQSLAENIEILRRTLEN